MSTTTSKPSGQPIYDRFAGNLPKASVSTEKSTLDSQADKIRKAWLQSTPARSQE
jgi:hypothetical protein